MDHTAATAGTTDAEQRRKLWAKNARIFGPWVVVALLMTTLANPLSASAAEEPTDQLQLNDCVAFKVARVVDDCCFTRSLAQFDGECCIREDVIAGAQLNCEEETPVEVPATSTPIPPTATPEPVTDMAPSDGLEPPPTPTPTPTVIGEPRRNLIPPPPPLRGPTWMGPITPVPAPQVTLQVPPLLAIFLARNEVTVTNADGAIVFKGIVPPNRKLVLSTPSATGAGSYTVVGLLIRGSKYTEVVSVDPLGPIS